MTDRCNQFGVHEADETLVLPFDRKGWRGVPTAEIELRDLGTHWIWSASYCLMSGDHQGHFSPLTDHPRYRQPTRQEALDAARADLRAPMDGRDSRDAKRIVQWLEGLNPVQGSLF